MKAGAISQQLWSLEAWMLIPFRVWVFAGDDGLTLIDTGIGMMAKGIRRFVEDSGKPLKRILLTHGHSDHVGSLSKLLAAFPDVPVYAHPIEIPYLEGRMPYPRRSKAVAVVGKGAVLPLELDETGRLLPIGGLQPYHTPGHSPGHTAYYEPSSGTLLAGDLFTSKRGRLKRPMASFTADMGEAVLSGAIVERLQPSRLEICHGGPVLRPAEQIDAYLQRESGRMGLGL